MSRLKRLGMSMSSWTQCLSKMIRPTLSNDTPSTEVHQATSAGAVCSGTLDAPEAPGLSTPATLVTDPLAEVAGSDFHEYALPLQLKNLEKWEAKHNPVIYRRAKYLPYPALRQQFWRAMLRQYDAD